MRTPKVAPIFKIIFRPHKLRIGGSDFEIRGGRSRPRHSVSGCEPDAACQRLRAAAGRLKVPANVLAREAIDLWLRQQLHKARREEIAANASEAAGTTIDFEADLAEAGIY
jgi:hypothetical protein